MKIIPNHIANIHKRHSGMRSLLTRLAALFLLLLCVPLFICVALCIRLDSRGPCFYSQKRVGLRGQVFTLYKFRSMKVDAEPHGATWAEQKDKRATRSGRYLRRWHIDELPQLWNIACGHMGFIGPRPERVEFVRRLQKSILYYNVRHALRPGLTGLAQICCPYGASVEAARRKLEYDVYYVQHASWMLDVRILLYTVPRILFPDKFYCLVKE